MAHEVLIVDDEADIREQLSGILGDEGFETRVAKDSDTALVEIEARRPSMVILDIWLNGSTLDGLGLLDVIKRDYVDLPVVMISGHGNIETAVAAIKCGAWDFIEKPFETDRLLLITERAIESARVRREYQDLKERAGGEPELIGASAAMTALRTAIDRVAPTGSRVLVTGPPGSGKEVVARLIHERSRRAGGPFVVLNAASMAPERMEAELFGFEDAAGATERRRVGTFERAHGGTLFLDEVADMPLATQAKILRVLLDQVFERVGGSARIEVDVRVISASSRNLKDEIAAGRLREDLYHRLNVVPIPVPPLRARREDIPSLIEHFIRWTADTTGLARRTIAEDALAALQSNEWPGNVRELRNVVERLLIMAPGDSFTSIGADMLPPELGSPTFAALRPNGSEEVMALPLRRARERFEREYLSAQIARFGGNVSRTAAFVGMERSALHRKLKTLGVGGSDPAASGVDS